MMLVLKTQTNSEKIKQYSTQGDQSQPGCDPLGLYAGGRFDSRCLAIYKEDVKMDILVGLLYFWLAFGGLMGIAMLFDLMAFRNGEESWFFEECIKEKKENRRKRK